MADAREVLLRANCARVKAELPLCRDAVECSCSKQVDRELAALSAAGLKVLGREPTPEMVARAKVPGYGSGVTWGDRMHYGWRHMWDAAEPAAHPTQGERHLTVEEQDIAHNALKRSVRIISKGGEGE